MTGKYILDKKGNPVEEPDLFKWADWVETSGKSRIVKQTHISGKYLVSTVFLALDHSFVYGGNVPPILYETMTFSDNEELPDEIELQNRYSTKAEALEGHKQAVKLVKNYVKTHGKNK